MPRSSFAFAPGSKSVNRVNRYAIYDSSGRFVTIMASVSMKPFSKPAGEKRTAENS